MDTLFTKIINGEVPSYKVAEDSFCFAFLDINPNTKGHVLCVPKMPVDKIFDLPEENFHHLMAFSRKVALGLRKVVPCKRIALSVIGLEVPHAHVHLIPIEKMSEATFQSKTALTPDEMQILAVQISKAVDQLS
ncbi:HIT family protein [Flavobacteriaceae bacterium]|nr:HIT family protein [Flavobacteriaceae bacterium]MDA9572047.1 HIT family protein [Flavobacteriaceae bacterium]MDB3862254.1 HIT family protein [Flavobacteriaceae bacterium]